MFLSILHFRLLSGNANIVRVPSKPFPQVAIICDEISRLFQLEKYQSIQKQTTIISYDKDDKKMTDALSSLCDVRIIWGGDKTIHTIRKSPIKARGIELTFADRYSMGVISAKAVKNASDDEIRELAHRFYNDTYLMDQNACSTPHIIFWEKDESVDMVAIKERFWDMVCQIADKYDLEDCKVSEKYTELCKVAMKS